MKARATPLLLVPFSEVLHEKPEDCLHYESVAVRGQEMDWTIPAHCHEGLHQFQWLQSGTLGGTIDGRAFDAVAPVMLMLAPGSVHGFTYSRDAVGHQVTVPTNTLQRLLAGSHLAQSQLSTSFFLGGDALAGSAGAMLALFEQLAGEFNAQRAGRVHALHALATLIAVEFLRRRGEATAGHDRQGARDTLVQRFRALAEAHFREHRPLSYYAGALCVSADHLSRSCRQATGMSALDLLHGRVFLEARRLLAYTPMTIAHVAEQLGYSDPAYFSKFFTRIVGDTPSQYRTLVARGLRTAAGDDAPTPPPP